MATLVRTAVIFAALALLVTTVGKVPQLLDLSGRTVAFLVLSGLAAGASWYCYFRALQLGEASRVAPVDKLSVVLVAVCAAVFLGERPTAREWGGIGLVGLGVVVVAWKR